MLILASVRARYWATLGVDQITLAPVAVQREPSLSAEQQKRQLAEWQAKKGTRQ